MGVLRQMTGKHGDRNVLRWGTSAREIAAARQMFDTYRAQGFDLYRLTADEERGAPITEFDPGAPGILAVPRMEGG